ncbi:MAG: transposase, partial [Stellaceae bacterium]
MTMGRRFTAEFKARVALEALRGDKTVQEIAAHHKVHLNQVSRWKRQAMIAPERPGLSLSRQCRLLSISRSSFYYTPKGESPENLALMRRIDELFLRYPFFGSRQMVRQLRREGLAAGRPRVRRPDAAHGPGGDLSGAQDQHAASGAPGLSVSAAERGGGLPRSCLVRRHHLHPGTARVFVLGGGHGLGEPPGAGVAAVDHTMEAAFCVEALEEVLARYGTPEICKVGDERRSPFGDRFLVASFRTGRAPFVTHPALQKTWQS